MNDSGNPTYFLGERPRGRKEGIELSKEILPREGYAMIKTLFIIGLVIIGTAAALLLMGKIEAGVAAIVGIIGIGVISSANLGRLAQTREKRP